MDKLHPEATEASQFVQTLHDFHRGRGTDFKFAPKICGQEIDLHALYKTVTAAGGSGKLNERPERWYEITHALRFPDKCPNGTLVLRQIYQRYLGTYEKVTFLGEDPDLEVEDSGEITSSSFRTGRTSSRAGGSNASAFVIQVPMSYNRQQHEVTDGQRANYGLSTQLAPPASPFERLCFSLQSGLPNEETFALNVCTLLANGGRHTMQLSKAPPRLVDLLVSQAGLVADDPTLRETLDEPWRTCEARRMTRFWQEHVDPAVGLCLGLPPLDRFAEAAAERVGGRKGNNNNKKNNDDVDDDEDDDNNNNGRNTDGCVELLAQGGFMATREALEDEDDLFNLDNEVSPRDAEAQRVLRIALILHNLSFEEANAQILAQNQSFLRMMMLASVSRWASLRHVGLDCLSNVALHLQLNVHDDVVCRSLLKLTIDGILKSEDRGLVTRCLDILTHLAQCESNQQTLVAELDSSLLERLLELLTVHDVLLIIHSLEALYALTELGDGVCERLVAVRHAIGMLVSMLSLDPIAYGLGAQRGMKIVEHFDPLLPPATAPLIPPVSVHAHHGHHHHGHAQLMPAVVQAASATGPGGIATAAASGAAGTSSSPHMAPPATPVQPHVVRPMQPNAERLVAGLTQPPVGATPPAHPATPGGSADAGASSVSETEALATAWIRAHIELTPGASVGRQELYADYVNFCSKAGRRSVLSGHHFSTCIRTIFPQSTLKVTQVASPNQHLTQVFQYENLRRRSVPLTVTVTQTVASHLLQPGGTGVVTTNVAGSHQVSRNLQKQAALGSARAASLPEGAQAVQPIQAVVLQSPMPAATIATIASTATTTTTSLASPAATTTGAAAVIVVGAGVRPAHQQQQNGVVTGKEMTTATTEDPAARGGPRGVTEEATPTSRVGSCGVTAVTMATSATSTTSLLSKSNGNHETPGTPPTIVSGAGVVVASSANTTATTIAAAATTTITTTTTSSTSSSCNKVYKSSPLLNGLLDRGTANTPIIQRTPGVIGSTPGAVPASSAVAVTAAVATAAVNGNGTTVDCGTGLPSVVGNNSSSNNNNGNNGSGTLAVTTTTTASTGRNRLPLTNGEMSMHAPSSTIEIRKRRLTFGSDEPNNQNAMQVDQPAALSYNASSTLSKLLHNGTSNDSNPSAATPTDHTISTTTTTTTTTTSVSASTTTAAAAATTTTACAESVSTGTISSAASTTAGTTTTIPMETETAAEIAAAAAATVPPATVIVTTATTTTAATPAVSAISGATHPVNNSNSNSSCPDAKRIKLMQGQGKDLLHPSIKHTNGDVTTTTKDTPVHVGVATEGDAGVKVSVGNIPGASGGSAIVVVTKQSVGSHAKEVAGYPKVVTTTTTTAPQHHPAQGEIIEGAKQSNSTIPEQRRDERMPTPAPEKRVLRYHCEWKGCEQTFSCARHVLLHALYVHVGLRGNGNAVAQQAQLAGGIDPARESLFCQWGVSGDKDSCDGMARRRLSLCTHVQERHCSEAHLHVQAIRRQQISQFGAASLPAPSQPPPHPGYAADAAAHAIRRHAASFHAYRDAADEREHPVTRSVRLTAALILRNLARHVPSCRTRLVQYESRLAQVAMSALESSRTVSQCLADLHVQQDPARKMTLSMEHSQLFQEDTRPGLKDSTRRRLSQS